MTAGRGAGSRADQSTVRRLNTGLVLATIAADPGISRAGTAARTGLAKATVSALVDRLVEADLVTETGLQARPGRRGRPGTALSPSRTGPHGLGVEIGVDYLAVCLLDLTGRVRNARVVPADSRGLTPAQVLTRTARVIRTELEHADGLGVPVGGLGVALPGLVGKDGGTLRAAPNLGWRDVDLAAELRDRLPLADLPVLVGNEADMGACAELWSGAHGGLRDFLYVSGEAGVGAGIVVDGALFRGVRGFGGEIGHSCVDPDGPRCRCGARGCLEAVAGTEAILAAAGIAAPARPDPDPDPDPDPADREADTDPASALTGTVPADPSPDAGRETVPVPAPSPAHPTGTAPDPPPAAPGPGRIPRPRSTTDAYDALLARLEGGDARAVEAVDQAGRRLGVALSGAVNTLDLPTVVLGSRYAALERWLRPSLEAELAERVPSSRWEPVRVLRGSCGQQAAALGAARTVTEAVLTDPDAHLTGR